MVLGKNVKTTPETDEKAVTETEKTAKATTAKAKDKNNPHNLPADILAQLKEFDLKNAVLDEACIISKTDKRGYITYINDKFCEVSGFAREELIGQNHNMVRHPDMPKSVFKEVWATIGKGQMFKGNIKNRCKDGSHYWVDAYITPIMGDNGKPESYIGIRFDITTLMEAKDAGDALKTAVDAGWAYIEFNPNGEILSANRNFLNATGYDSENDIIGKHHRIFCDKEYAKSPEYTKFWNDLGNGEVQSGEFKRITKNGNELYLNASYTPVKDLNGKIVKVVKLASDVTAVKNTVAQINSVVSMASQGDLSERLDTSTAEGDYKVMGESINQLLDAIVAPLKDVKNISNVVASSSEEMLSKGEQMKSSTGEMSSAVQEMAEGAQDQAQQIDETSKLIENILTAAQQMASGAQTINKTAEEGKESSKAGVITMSSVVESMEGILRSADLTSNSIDVLAERSEEIARTLNVITDIASQTNLLALNAAIEAARAGDAGRGFAVVAEEIRKLAEDSRNSAKGIEKVITEVQKDVNSASKAIQEMEVSVKTGNKASKEAEEAFRKIDSSSEQTLSLSLEIMAATEEQERSVNDTVKNIEKIVVVSEETASGTEELAASSKDLREGMEEVSATSRDLADVANQLLESVSKFKLDK